MRRTSARNRGVRRRGHAAGGAPLGNIAVHEIDFGAPALGEILRGARAAALGAALQTFEHAPFDFSERRRIPLCRSDPLFRGQASYRLQLVAQCIADLDGLRGEADLHAARRLQFDDLVEIEAGKRRQAGCHRVSGELGPALAPQIGSDFCAVHAAQQSRQSAARGRWRAHSVRRRETPCKHRRPAIGCARYRPGATASTLIVLAMQPSVLPQPAMRATSSSTRPFCIVTTQPPGERYGAINAVAQAVSYSFMQMKAMSIAEPARLCTSATCSALTRTVCSPWVPPSCRPPCLIAATCSAHGSINVTSWPARAMWPPV